MDNDFDPLSDMIGRQGIALAWTAIGMIVAAVIGMIILVHCT